MDPDYPRWLRIGQSMIERAMREVFRREILPARARWWMAAAGMLDWYGFLGSRLRPHLGERSREVVARAARRTILRRVEVLAARLPRLREETSALFAAAIYRLYAAPRATWILDAVGGPPRGARAWWSASEILAPLDAEERWREVTVHLGELLVVLTEDLPGELPHARKILGDICKEAGARYAKRMKRMWKLPDEPDDPVALSIEILRTSEYLFRVNPEHWSASDPASRTGFLEGTACPWYERPGWNGAHCGIFGQFQAGVTGELGLRYLLAKTIPKHGGGTCRVELKPLDPSTLVRR
jgi:hypothetical protein